MQENFPFFVEKLSKTNKMVYITNGIRFLIEEVKLGIIINFEISG